MHLLHYKINVSYMHGGNCVRGNIIYIILIQMTIKFYMYIQIATQGIVKYCLRGFMAKQQRDTLLFLGRTYQSASRNSCYGRPGPGQS